MNGTETEAGMSLGSELIVSRDVESARLDNTDGDSTKSTASASAAAALALEEPIHEGCRTQPFASLRNLCVFLGTEDRMKMWRRAELVILAAVIAVAWGLLLLPVIFYHLPEEKHETCETYTRTSNINQVCHNALQTLSGTCFPESSSRSTTEMYIFPRGGTQQELELILSTGLKLVGPSPECKEVIVPFLCLYYLRLCDGEGEVTYRPSVDDCVDISTEICSKEWDEANKLLQGLGQSLPLCETLQNQEASQCDVFDGDLAHLQAVDAPNASMEGSGHGIGASGNDSCPGKCRSDFQCHSGFCRPRCGQWKAISDTVSTSLDTVILFSALTGLFAGIAVLLLSCIRRKKMFTFPSIIIVYHTITALVLAAFVLINYTDRVALFCGSTDLLESVDKPTLFCSISGAVLYYVLLQLAVWWFFHVLVLFWKLRFPIHARTFESARRFKYIHCACIITGLGLPLTPVVTVFANGGFTMSRFPPLLCTGREGDPTFYSLVLPIIVLLQFGVSMLLVMFWRVHKTEGLFRENRSINPMKMGTAEKKIFIIFCYYVLLGVIALSTFTYYVKEDDKVIAEYKEYFLCESKGIDSDLEGSDAGCDKSGFQYLHPPAISAVSYVLTGLFPAVSLIFVVNIQELKQICSPKVSRFCSRWSKRPLGGRSSNGPMVPIRPVLELHKNSCTGTDVQLTDS